MSEGPHHSRPILEQSPHGGLEPLEIDRLCQVGVEAGFLGALDIFLHAKTGERDGWRLPGFSYLPDEVDAGAIGQTQIAEKKIEILSPDGFERGGDIWGDLCREAAVFQQIAPGRARCRGDLPRVTAALCPAISGTRWWARYRSRQGRPWEM